MKTTFVLNIKEYITPQTNKFVTKEQMHRLEKFSGGTS
jgi:hypothetical protein